MGHLFRSEEMVLCQLFLQSEAAYDCLSELGELGMCQFKDLNPDINSFQRKFVNEIRRLDDMERILRFAEKEINKSGIPIEDNEEMPDAPQPREMINMEATFEKLESEIKEVNRNSSTLKRNFLDLTELHQILEKTQVFFDQKETAGAEITASLHINEDVGGHDATTGPIQLGFIAGVMRRDRLLGFERMLWRACRGNVFLRHAEIDDILLEDPNTGEEVQKNVFIVFFQGDQLKTRVKKICEGYRATMYHCPDGDEERRQMYRGITVRLGELSNVLGETEAHRTRLLEAAAAKIKAWFVRVRKMKAIYHTLNMFNVDVTQKCLIGECWIPVIEMTNVQSVLQRGAKRSGSHIPPILNKIEFKKEPPTYNRTNKFTNGFQNLIDGYGVGNYQEVNPAPYTCITFPFLFAVMFGDIGHGFIVTLFASWMCFNEKKLAKQKDNGEMWDILFAGRYIVLLMGLFSMYTGLIYNDLFSKSINIFGTAWRVNYNDSTLASNADLSLDPKYDYLQYPYPLGIDPIWQTATNKINYLNAYKMKLSIIFGITHMIAGVFLSTFNDVHFRQKINIFCEFVPRILFLVLIFFYLCFLMFFKWVHYYANDTDMAHDSECAPSILITFINMFLFGTAEVLEGCSAMMFDNQQMIQTVFLVVAVICIPWMLLLKPVIISMRRKRQKKQVVQNGQHHSNGHVNDGYVQNEEVIEMDTVHAGHSEEEEEEEEPMSEVWMEQGIHTIEYVLASISHTASYLRLWALSLAHSQLSEVLWSMTLRLALARSMFYGYVGSAALFCLFTAWAVLTIAILVLMEGLSAFLHTLRLHWVEFNSKFFKGDGLMFAPFSFEAVLALAEVEEEGTVRR